MNSPKTISLPSSLIEWAQEHAGERGFGNVSDYVSELIRNDQAALVKAKIRTHLLESAKGPKRELTDKVWDEMLAKGLKKSRKQANRK